jgi:plastocyanin
MTMRRRRFLVRGSGVIATLVLSPLLSRPARAGDTIEIEMTGRTDGAEVWFDPVGLWISPGQTVRWTNRDPGDSHTATAYHPDIKGRPRRSPKDAKPWDSDFLLPDESYSVTLSQPGVYDYYCRPHEHAGMVGRIVVGDIGATDWWSDPKVTSDQNLPPAALQMFPPVQQIIERKSIRHG